MQGGPGQIELREEALSWKAVRSQGAGGQNVNKVATAVQVFYDIKAGGLGPEMEERLRRWPDQRITEEGIIVIKAQDTRTQERNLELAKERLRELIWVATRPRKKRRPTRKTASSQARRVEGKTVRSRIKRMRGRVDGE